MACREFDEQVARLRDGLDELADRFVRVRVTAMDGVDLGTYQFDFDMTWAGLFLNADGTVYGRFGTRDGGPYEAEELVSTVAFRAAMEGALRLHEGYPDNAIELIGKQSRSLPWKTVEDVPVPRRIGMGDCTHCHHVAEGLGRVALDRGEAVSDQVLWPFPTAARIGVEVDVDAQDQVAAVIDGSAADVAGLKSGDRLARLEGQPILSHADIQWVLHHAPEVGSLTAELVREGARVEAKVPLIPGWRRGSGAWRESRRMLRPGFSVHRLDADEREAAGRSPDGMALRVGRVFDRGVVRGGVLRDDLVIEYEGDSPDWTEEDFLAELRQRRRAGERFSLVVLRAGERRALDLVIP